MVSAANNRRASPSPAAASARNPKTLDGGDQSGAQTGLVLDDEDIEVTPAAAQLEARGRRSARVGQLAAVGAQSPARWPGQGRSPPAWW